MSAQALFDRIVDNILNPIVLLLMAVALVYFIYGIVIYIKNANDETKRKEGQQHVLWGLVGLTIMVGAWGILYFVSNTVKETTTSEDTLLDEYELMRP